MQTLSGPLALTVTDTGGQPLVFSGFSLAGRDPRDFVITSDGCLGQIVAGASCEVDIAFAPQGAGARSASLQIASNDPASPASVPLSGTGKTAPSEALLLLNKATLTYGREQREQFRVTVTSTIAGTPAGKVAIRARTRTLCTVTLAAGTGSCSPKPKALPIGRHTITAAYSGDTHYQPSTSRSKTLTVKP